MIVGYAGTLQPQSRPSVGMENAVDSVKSWRWRKTREHTKSRGRENYRGERERGGVGVAEGRIAADGESEQENGGR